MNSRVLKRAVDVVIAGTVLVLAALPMLAIAVLIRMTIGPPVLFYQIRPGKDRRPFKLRKFRTMVDAHGPDGRVLSDGQRLTRLGRFLRRTSLDELPQLWNVLTGEMSLVGPRPLLSRYLPYYTERECLRFTALPGITGWAQIHGRNHLSWDKRLALDVWYVENWSLRLDLRILLLTLFVVLTQKGMMVDPYFTGGKDLDEERRGRAKGLVGVSSSPC